MNEPKWETSLREQWANVPFEELLDECLSRAKGDDYDGLFTNRGWEEYNVLVELLKSRIKRDAA